MKLIIVNRKVSNPEMKILRIYQGCLNLVKVMNRARINQVLTIVSPISHVLSVTNY